MARTKRPNTFYSASFTLDATPERRRAFDARCAELSLGSRTEATYQDGAIHLVRVIGLESSVVAVKVEFAS